jgi:hypothetical protein
MTVTLLAIVAVAAACGLAVVVWAQYRDAQQRSAARVAALAAAIDGRSEPAPAAAGTVDPFGTFAAERPAFASSWQAPAMPSRRGWIMAAGAVPLLLVLVALFATRGPRTASSPPAARQPQSLELLAMHHDRAGDRLTVTGTVRVRGRDTAPVTAVVTGRDSAGRIVARADAPLDDASLDIGGESSFQVSVAGAHDVSRYQVRFETPLGPVTHIDRRAERTTAAITP